LNKGENDQYQIRFTTGAKKDLKSKACKPYLKEIFRTIGTLKNNPLAGKCLEGSLLKVRSLHVSLKGSGQWRVAYYAMIEERTCLVIAIGPRENFYKKANTRYKAIKAKLEKNRNSTR
jgi:mRNA-degrading endonuclease RelE of RelBE toxin-antitoxin system